MKQSDSYKSIAKGTATFGGIQVFNILINLIRGKLVAILLGTEGMGIASLLTTAANSIQQLSSLGLNLSIVKEVSQANENQNPTLLTQVIKLSGKLLRLTSLLGALLTCCLSGLLSEWTFGSTHYQWYFIGLSVFIFLTTLSNGELSILQGIRAIRKLAYASVIGSITGLLIGVPLYYYFGYDGIVPAMIILSLSLYIFYYYQRRCAVQTEIVETPSILSPQTKQMLSLGIVMMLSTLLGTLASYLLNLFIRNIGSLDDVGLYQAAHSITNQYSGLVFTAISMDFMPRLAAINTNNSKVRLLVNQQTEIISLAITPLVLTVILLAPTIIRLLLTDKFLSLIPVIRLMAIGILFKSISFPMGYISFAKGDKRTFFWLEGISSNLLTLTFNCIAFYYWGIVGVSIAFTSVFAIYTFIYIYLTHRLYHFKHTRSCIRIIITLILFGIAGLACSFISQPIYAYPLTAGITIIATIYSLRELNKRLSLLQFIKNKIKR